MAPLTGQMDFAMNKYLKQDEKLPGEEILSVIPYKPFSILIITNQRIIGKRLLRIGPKRFEGTISYDKILSVKYLPGRPLITVPSILFEYKREDGGVEKVTVRFPGFTARLAGFSPEAVYRLIAKQTNTKDEPAD